MKEKRNIVWVSLLLLAFALSRWPGLLPQNFSAAYALVFCAGVFHRRLPWWAVGTVLLGTDIIKNVWHYRTDPVSDYMIAIYASYLVLFWLGRKFSPAASQIRLIGGGLLGAVVFYLLSNTASWLQNPEYVKSISGWIQALTVGTSGWPETWKFFSNTLLSGGLFTAFIAAAFKMQPESATEEVEESAEEKDAETEPEPSRNERSTRIARS